jgi:hypothetical protein
MLPYHHKCAHYARHVRLPVAQQGNSGNCCHMGCPAASFGAVLRILCESDCSQLPNAYRARSLVCCGSCKSWLMRYEVEGRSLRHSSSPSQAYIRSRLPNPLQSNNPATLSIYKALFKPRHDEFQGCCDRGSAGPLRLRTGTEPER